MSIDNETATLYGVLFALLRQPVSFHPILAEIGGSIAAGLFLSQAFYWTPRGTHDDNGWFHRTTQQWRNDTTMSRKEQETARKYLRTRGFLEEKRVGVPAKLWFRINLSAIYAAMQKRANSEPQALQNHQFVTLGQTSLSPHTEPQALQNHQVVTLGQPGRDIRHSENEALKNQQVATSEHSGKPVLPDCDKLVCHKVTNKSAPNGHSISDTTTEKEIQEDIVASGSVFPCLSSFQPDLLSLTPEATISATVRAAALTPAITPAAVPTNGVAKKAVKKSSPDWSIRDNWPEENRWLYDALTTQPIFDLTALQLWDYPWWDAVSYCAGGLNTQIIEEQFATMQAWFIENPREKPRSISGMKRFIRSWFQRFYRDRRRENSYGKTVRR